jgi:PIN domain nuclease of toxin-antitoxin system
MFLLINIMTMVLIQVIYCEGDMDTIQASEFKAKCLALMDDVAASGKTLLNAGLTELPLTGEIAMRSNELLSLHGDPADRFIATTAIEHHAELITADEHLLDWRHGLQRHDARV